MDLNSAEELISEIKKGNMVLLMDDEDRENEGDLILAGEKATAEKINFMAKHARGLICLAMSQSKCEALNLNQMVNDNKSGHGTGFTISIEAKKISKDNWEVYTLNGREKTGINVKDWIKEITDNGAGEVLLKSTALMPVKADNPDSSFSSSRLLGGDACIIGNLLLCFLFFLRVCCCVPFMSAYLPLNGNVNPS